MSEGEAMKIGITGTIGAGKSSFSNYLRKCGYQVYDMDKLTHSFYEPQGVLYSFVIDLLGDEVLNADTTLNRQVMSDILFRNQELLTHLEKRVFPEVATYIEKVDTRPDELVFFEVPLLFEAKMESLFDVIVMVSANLDIRLKRLQNRGMNPDDVKRRIKRQYSEQVKEEKSDFIIYNNDTLDALYNKMDGLLIQIQKGGCSQCKK